MTLVRRGIVLACLMLALVLGAPAVAAWPEKPLVIIVPFAAGGPTDLCARIAASGLSAALGQSVVVDNKPGAGGNIGINTVARARPDGYTLLVVSSAFFVNPSLYHNSPFDPVKDFAPIAYFGASPNAVAIRPELGINTLQELIAAAKAQPDFFNYASPGSGTTPQLAAELIKARAGINLTHVPYPGAAPATQAILSGTTHIAVTNLASLLPHIKAGTIKGLVQTGEERWPEIPDVPTMADAGFPGAESDTAQIMLAPAGTPPEIVARLVKETLAVFEQKETKERLFQFGFAVHPQGPDYLSKRIAEEVPRWKDVITTAGVHVE